MKKFITCLVVTLISISMIFCFSACNDKKDASNENVLYSSENGKAVELGKGQTKFDLTVVDNDGITYDFIISTDKTILGEALEELGLIEGTEGQYGLYMEKVNGITAKYEIDQTYWAFYVNDEMSMVGIDQTEITQGAKYSLKVEG